MDTEMWNYFLEWITVMLVYYTYFLGRIHVLGRTQNIPYAFFCFPNKLLSKVRNTLIQSCFVQKPALKK